MNLGIRFSAILIAVLLLPTVDSDGGTVSRKIIRKYKGWYTGRVYGAYGETTGALQEVTPIDQFARFYVGGPNVSTVESGTGRRYQVIFSRPRGSSRRITLIGTYSGSFVNPNNGETESVWGRRRAVIREKGRNRLKYVMRVSDNLTEGTLSYWRYNGTLRK